MKTLAWTLCVAFFGQVAALAALQAAEPAHRVLPEDFNRDKSTQMMRSFLRKHAHQSLDQRRLELESALQSREAFAKYQGERQAYLERTFFPLSSRDPNISPPVATMGRIPADGFTIEKLLIESQPGFHITANLYRPDGEGPFPAILHPVGHTENGKAAVSYQLANQLLVKHGFIVLCYDPIGQGERKQLLDARKRPLYQASGEHQQLGPGAILLGTGLGNYMAWDGIRALDYLCNRADVDSKRIGCTGNSGGGNMTSYLMAFDPRIQAAAPGCFMTIHRQKNEQPGPGDAEQNLYAQIRDGFDHPDFILARAPRPTLILAATDDFVPIDGTWQAFRQAKRAYTLMGSPENVQLVEAKAKHGFSRTLREAAVRFFARWLHPRNIEVFEADEREATIYSAKDLKVTPNAQVAELPQERTLLQLYADAAAKLEESRSMVTPETVRRVCGARPAKALDATVRSVANATPTAPQKLVFVPEEGISLPAVYWREGTETPVLLIPHGGMNSVATQAAILHQQGHPVLILEVRDTGETATTNWRFFGADYYIAHMLGRCWLGMQVEDTVTAATWLRRQHKHDSIQLVATPGMEIVGLHAAVLEPQLIESFQADREIESWQALLQSTNCQRQIHNTMHGVLKHYDLPDLRAILKKR